MHPGTVSQFRPLSPFHNRSSLSVSRNLALPLCNRKSLIISTMNPPSYSIRPHFNSSQQRYYDVTIFGRTVLTVLTTDPQFVDSWINNFVFPQSNGGAGTSRQGMVSGLIVGVEIHPPAIIQLCINDRCLIYHMRDAPTLPLSLGFFFTKPGNSFYGVGLDKKISELRRHTGYTGSLPVHNLGFLAAIDYVRPDLYHSDMSDLALIVLRKRLVMPPVDPDWDRAELLDEQVMHACIGAFVSCELGKVLDITQDSYY